MAELSDKLKSKNTSTGGPEVVSPDGRRIYEASNKEIESRTLLQL